VHALLAVFWFPPLNQMGIMQKGSASILLGWRYLRRAALQALASSGK